MLWSNHLLNEANSAKTLLYLVLIRCGSSFRINYSFPFFFLAKAKKAPAGAGKKGPFSDEEIPSSRRPRESPVPFSGGLGEGSGTSTPVLTEPSGKWESTSQVSPWPVRTFFKTFKSKRTGLSTKPPWKSLLLFWGRYYKSRRPSKGIFICRWDNRAWICMRVTSGFKDNQSKLAFYHLVRIFLR